MDKDTMYEAARAAAEQFDFGSPVTKLTRYGNGHINDTFLATCGNDTRFIFQRVNQYVFHHPDEVMENICRVTAFLRKKIIENGGDPDRETLNTVPARDGKPYFHDTLDYWWRTFLYIDDSRSLDTIEKPEDYYEGTRAFGRFQYLLSDYDAASLYETIPDFHNTPRRFEHFKEVVAQDACGRVKDAQAEIDFLMGQEKLIHLTYSMQESGELPLRVTHNDTKLNNVLIDNRTGKGLCVIDLDTVMPGLSINDFGDAIRIGANTGAEDEQDLSRVSLSLENFELCTRGFLDGCSGSLTDRELAMLPYGAMTMTLENGMRFLADHLEGDPYYRIHYPGQNLVRCRAQFELVRDMERKLDQMREIIGRVNDI